MSCTAHYRNSKESEHAAEVMLWCPSAASCMAFTVSLSSPWPTSVALISHYSSWQAFISFLSASRLVLVFFLTLLLLQNCLEYWIHLQSNIRHQLWHFSCYLCWVYTILPSVFPCSLPFHTIQHCFTTPEQYMPFTSPQSDSAKLILASWPRVYPSYIYRKFLCVSEGADVWCFL
jgi:hypothetical protein